MELPCRKDLEQEEVPRMDWLQEPGQHMDSRMGFVREGVRRIHWLPEVVEHCMRTPTRIPKDRTTVAGVAAKEAKLRTVEEQGLPMDRCSEGVHK